MTRAVKVQECASLGLKVVQLFAELLEDLSALFGLIDWLSQDFPFIWLLFSSAPSSSIRCSPTHTHKRVYFPDSIFFSVFPANENICRSRTNTSSY